ncbi:MAG: HPr family phosphocarrier protein [Clostridiales bacterium]|nr:HPr family phosphocarrier protein [Roseburia sp.]MDD7638123.1 HPr family phosphocarrier protein [Clostridiales bacterium]MDY4113317.1 HPr family phosphocarrier protein [Roseburia sp.]
MKKSVVIRMQGEFEARPIANLVQEANKYTSQIYLEVDEKRVNAKSIMGMMSLALMNGDTVVLDVQGEDEEAAIAGLEKFLAE